MIELNPCIYTLFWIRNHLFRYSDLTHSKNNIFCFWKKISDKNWWNTIKHDSKISGFFKCCLIYHISGENGGQIRKNHAHKIGKNCFSAHFDPFFEFFENPIFEPTFVVFFFHRICPGNQKQNLRDGLSVGKIAEARDLTQKYLRHGLA